MASTVLSAKGMKVKKTGASLTRSSQTGTEDNYVSLMEIKRWMEGGWREDGGWMEDGWMDE